MASVPEQTVTDVVADFLVLGPSVGGIIAYRLPETRRSGPPAGLAQRAKRSMIGAV